MTISAQPSVFIQCVNRAIEFEPSLEMKKRLDKNKETFAQYVVRLLSYVYSASDLMAERLTALLDVTLLEQRRVDKLLEDEPPKLRAMTGGRR